MAILGVQDEEILSWKVQRLPVLYNKKVKVCKERLVVQNCQKNIVENIDLVKIVILPDKTQKQLFMDVLWKSCSENALKNSQENTRDGALF